jgi:hypothetical protein
VLERQQTTRERRTELLEQVIELKREELSQRRFQSRVNPLPDYSTSQPFRVEKPVSCTYCMSRDHNPAECPKLIRDRGLFATP